MTLLAASIQQYGDCEVWAYPPLIEDTGKPTLSAFRVQHLMVDLRAAVPQKGLTTSNRDHATKLPHLFLQNRPSGNDFHNASHWHLIGHGRLDELVSKGDHGLDLTEATLGER